MLYRSSCKINIGLNVISKREDGFHNIESLMFPVLGLYDEIEIFPRADREVVFIQSGITVDCLVEDNLCVRAYKLLMSKYGISGADIHINKKIPFGAGLGGGSSNAAFILKAVVETFGLNVDRVELIEFAATLGSDTPFFIDNKPSLATGRGDVLRAVELSLDGYYLTLVKPSININTKEAYSGVVPSTPEFDILEVLKYRVEEWRNYLKNDFEKHVFEKNLLLAEIKKTFYEKGALLAMMSGSGSTMYAISEQPIDTSSFDEKMFVFKQRIETLT